MTPKNDPGQLFIGLMSGTSMDGIDAALVRLDDRDGNPLCEVLSTCSQPYPADHRATLHRLSRHSGTVSLDDLGRADTTTGELFRDAAMAVLAESGKASSDVSAIGSHGQTLRHRPDDDVPYTLQVGDPNIIAQGTGITTVADFRRRDVAAGGQGAPLAPAFHRWLFHRPGANRVVLNLGGFANITVLPGDGSEVAGFDTGPANSLLDAWCQASVGETMDVDGRWAASGQVDRALLERLLADTYFHRRPPKSTGFEHFNLAWLRSAMADRSLPAADVQATLLALSVQSVAAAIRRYAPVTEEVLVCGGGVHNSEFMRQLADVLGPLPVVSTADCGADPDWVEAAAFAWLARQTLAGQAGNLPSVTAAASPEILGGVFLCTS